MAKRQYYLLLLTIIFSVLAIVFDNFTKQAINIKKYKSVIESYLHEQEDKVEQIFNNQDFVQEQLNTDTSVKLSENGISVLQELAKEQFTFCIYKQDSLVFWSNNRILPHLVDIQTKSTNRSVKSVKLQNGYYQRIKQSFTNDQFGEYTLLGLIPIKYEYQLESDYLKSEFATKTEIPSEIKLVNYKTDYIIHGRDKNPLCYLNVEGEIFDRKQLQYSLFLYLIAFIFLAMLINSMAKRIALFNRPLIGAVFLMVTVFGIRYFSILLRITDKFQELPIFARTFESPFLSNSLGDLLINIVLLLWIMIFFHREFKVKTFDHISPTLQFGITVLNYFSIFLAVLMLTSVFKSLVLNTDISFDFDNVFNLNAHSFIALIGVILLLVALFLFSHRMMLTIVKLDNNKYRRLLSLAVATVAALPILFFSNLELPLTQLMLIAFTYILIFDLFIDSERPNFTWLVIWLVIFSAFPSVLLFKYTGIKDFSTRIEYSKALSDIEDTIAEESLNEFIYKIKKDADLEKSLTRPYPYNKIRKNILQKKADDFVTNNSYLFNNYNYTTYAYSDKYKESIIEEQAINYTGLEQRLRQAKKAKKGNSYFWFDQINNFSYLVPIKYQEQSDNPITLLFEFKRARLEKSKVYTELLIDQQYKNLKDLGKYDYAIYKNNIRSDYEGKAYGSFLKMERLPEVGKQFQIFSTNRIDSYYRASDDIIVAMGRDTGNIYFKTISLFSYLFTLLVIIIIIISFINSVISILPESLNISFSGKPSLRNRIQLSVISLTVTSFLVIGIVTVWFFRTSSEEYHESRLERKTSSVLKDAEHEYLVTQADTTRNLSSMVNPLSQIHRMDVNLYDAKGDLISSSERDIFNKGIVTEKMDALAFQMLSKNKQNKYQVDEKVGSLSYKTAYVSLKNKDSETIAYLGLPYYSKQRKLRSDVTDFMSTLLSAYVFLLLVAGGIAIYVANSITRPIATVGEKIKQFKLGKRNKPLEWTTKDELGELISEYNKMIKQVEDSANKLAQSEREGAWREMAKQVAHEIKNPLTPMKLSIQYLQHAYQANPDDIEPLLKRVAATLIEQIDNLAAIASEFSNFAKMPRADNQKIELNYLVSSVFDLFRETENSDLSLELPDKLLCIYADRNHLMRVLNNLIKNATQAIPDDRRGKITVMLYTQDEIAIIEVKDNGTGIPQDKWDKVFVPNITTKNSGTGLGLAISKNIIESVDGRIYFETDLGIGTNFYVELPIVEIKELEEA